MEKLQIRYTPDEAEHIAEAIIRALESANTTAEVRELMEQARRLSHLAAKARARAARASAA